MKEKLINAKGELCPKPLIMTKKALDLLEIDEILVVLIDNETSKDNVEKYLFDNGVKFKTFKEDDTYRIQITSSIDNLSEISSKYCSVISKSSEQFNDYVICIKSNTMGNGPEDLGKILIQGFINTIKEISPLPKTIIFYNSGVNLAINKSPVLNPLKALEEKGIKILVCGTCVDYFKIKGDLGVGKISNMFDILEVLSSSSKVIYP